ncbi:hypothetical protein ACFY5F_35995 [Streptomyces sp. NPDC013161]|uniref:hypothetical protein n=1 Tax=Streptomyces sp. NPDC013161 TaxID=3364862 RepID=UPI00368DDA53
MSVLESAELPLRTTAFVTRARCVGSEELSENHRLGVPHIPPVAGLKEPFKRSVENKWLREET